MRHNRVIKPVGRVDAKIPRLVEHECVVWSEEEISGRMLVRIEDTGIPITAKPSDAFGDRGQRYFFVGIHRCAQPREMDGDRSDLLRMGRDSTDGGRPRASNVLKEGR